MTHTPQPGARYVVQGTLRHDGTTYQHGETFLSEDPELLANLHHLGAIRLPSEVEDPEVVAARQRGLEDENAALREELAKLKDAASAAPKSGRGKAAQAESEASEASEEAAAKAEE